MIVSDFDCALVPFDEATNGSDTAPIRSHVKPLATPTGSGTKSLSGDEFGNDVAVEVGESIVAAGVVVREFLVVKAQEF